MVRRISSAEEMFDILGSMSGGKFVTICHINYAHIDLPDERKKGFFNFILNRKEKGSFSRFGERFGLNNLSNIITVTRYRQLNWLPHNQLAKQYGEFRQAANNIRNEFGIPNAKKKKQVYKTMRYGGGIRVGNTPNTQGKAYVDQNTFSANRDVSYYGVDRQGNIIREFAPKELAKYLNYTRDIDGLNQLKQLTSNNNKINKYIQKILALKMEYTTFFNDRIMYMIGATQEGKFFFINDNLANNIEGIKINPQELTRITRQKYSKDCQIMNETIKIQKQLIENMKKNTVSLTEAQLHRVIKESVNKVLKEFYFPKYQENYDKNDEMDSDWENYGNLNRLDRPNDEIMADEHPALAAQRRHNGVERSGVRGINNGTLASSHAAARKYFDKHNGTKGFRW